MVFKDYYAILKCTIRSTDDEIKAQYRKLARKYHPDKTSGNKQLEEKLKDVNEAYEVLKDKKKRAQYDKNYYNEKSKTAVAKRGHSYVTKTQATDDNKPTIEMTLTNILGILFLGLGFMIILFEFINNNLMFYKYFYNTNFEFKKKCFINLLSTVVNIYTVIVSFTPMYVLIFNNVKQMITLRKIEVIENIKNTIASIVTIITFFLSFYEQVRFYLVIAICIIGNIYIIREKIWKKAYGIIFLIIMYVLFVPETFLSKSQRRFEICDGRIWCSGETISRYYKNTKKKI